MLPLRVRHAGGVLNLFTTVATFGTPLDVMVSELSIESFYPADEYTARELHGRRGLAPPRAESSRRGGPRFRRPPRLWQTPTPLADSYGSR